MQTLKNLKYFFFLNCKWTAYCIVAVKNLKKNSLRELKNFVSRIYDMGYNGAKGTP